jgi:acyl-coenzyme A synthetase/AMP-(fatty) acid ligase
MHLVDTIYFWARTTPLQPAIIRADGITSYHALAQGIERAAEYFAQNIIDYSKPVTVSLASAPKILVASLGLLRAGFSIIVATKSELQDLRTSDTFTLIYEKGGAPFDGWTNILFNESWLQDGVLPQVKPPRQRSTKNADIFFFRSGAAGGTKSIVRVQKSWEQRRLFNSIPVFSDYERALVVASATSESGFMLASEILYVGKTLCLAPFGHAALWLANTYGIDLVIATPRQALALADIQSTSTNYPLANLKTLRIDGPISRDGIQQIRNHLCRNIIVSYSSTETGTVALAPYDMIADIPSALGFVIPEAEVEIVDAMDNVLPVGSEGFVRVRTEQLVANFKIEDSSPWFYPGDLGWLTEQGVLCIARGHGAVSNRGEVKLSISDLEKFVLSCAGIKDAGACVFEDVSGLEEIWVAVVLDSSVNMARVRQQFEANQEFAANIDRVFVVDAVPRGGLGEIRCEDLKGIIPALFHDTISLRAAAESQSASGSQSSD